MQKQVRVSPNVYWKAEEDKRKQKKLEPLDRSLRFFDTFEMQRLAEKCQNLQRKMQRKKIRCI